MSVIEHVTTLDLETTINAQGDPSAHDRHNKVVALGIKALGSAPAVIEKDSPLSLVSQFPDSPDSKHVTVIGQNLAFDLAYLKRDSPHAWNNILKHHSVWDIQLAEYLITAQQSKMASLDDMSAKYGGTKKDDTITEMFKKGITPTFTQLKPYLDDDLKNTELVFLAQLDQVNKLGMLPLVKSQMEALLACVEATTNGVAVHNQKVVFNKSKAETHLDLTSITIVTLHPTITREVLDSPTKLGKALFGGKEKVKEKQQVGFYKNGNPKYKTELVEKEIKGICDPGVVVNCNVGKTATGLWQVDEGVLNKILDVYPAASNEYVLATLILRYRNYTKINSTYLIPFKKYMDQHVMYGHDHSGYGGSTSTIHHRLNQTITDTGRLSSSEPNLQNASSEDIVKGCFVPKIIDGVYVEIDFEQLEILGLALYTQDSMLLADIASGIDIHTALYNDMYSRTPTKEQRKAFKPLTFSLIYGASKTGIAEQGKISTSEATRFMHVFYGRYKEVAKWHTDLAGPLGVLAAHHDMMQTSTGAYSSTGHLIYAFVGPSKLTNRRLCYKQKEVEWKKTLSVSPTILKNYPIQSLATGDIVPMMLGYMIRRMANHDVFSDRTRCQFVNTVHDSLLFEVHGDLVEDFVNFMGEVLSKTAPLFKRTFKVPDHVVIPTFNLKVSTGRDWFNMADHSTIKGEPA